MSFKKIALLKRLLLIALLLIPAAVWSLYKPVRVLAPQFVSGISCVTETICIEDPARHAQAERLYNEALNFVESFVATMQHKPRIIFCSSEACFQSFGFVKSTARTLGVYGIVISPRGWTPYYLRHEMIHHIQAEQLGVYTQWRSPDWFKDGMAYALSEDPRQQLAEPMQGYRDRFMKWYRVTGKDKLWDVAKEL